MPRIIKLFALACLLMALGNENAAAAEKPLIVGKSSLQHGSLQRDFPAMCLDAAGAPWLAYVEYDGKQDTLWIARRAEEGLKSVAQVAGPGIIHQPAIAADGGGVWVFWSQVDEDREDRLALYGRRFVDGKPQGDRVTVAASDRNEVFCDATGDARGRVWVVWQSFRNGYGDIFARRVDGQGEWSDEIQISSHPAGDWEPRVACDADGRAAVVFDSSRGDEFNVYLALVAEDGSVDLNRLSKSPRYEGRSTIAAAADGKSFWIAWENGRQRWGKDSRKVNGAQGLNATKRVDVVHYDPATGKVTMATPLKPAVMAMLGGKGNTVLDVPEIAVDDGGNPWLACRYFQRTHWQIALARYEVKTGKWTKAITLPDSTFGQDRRTHARRAADGQLWLAWPSDRRTNKTARVSGVYLAEIDPAAAPAATVAGEQPAIRELPSLIGDKTPERTRQDRHEWTIGGKTYKLYWGDFHRHTDVSNCRTPDDGCVVEQFRYAYDAGKLDFLGTSDHTDIGKKYDPYEWWCNQKLADVFQSPGFFTSFYAYEREQRWPWGHRNVIFAERGGPIVYISRNLYNNSPWAKKLPVKSGPGQIAPQELWQVLRKDGRPVTVISHTGATGMGTDWDLYEEIDNAVENLVEIYQGARVSYEGINTPQPTVGYPRQGKEPYPGTDAKGRAFGKHNKGVYQNALKNGYKLGVFANSDHISTNTSFGGVYVEDFTREGIIEGLNARRTIAATDKILVELSVGDRPLGTVFQTDQKPELKMAVHGTAPIQRVTIVRNETNYRPFEPQANEFEATFTDPSPVVGENRYYIRVEQVDGNMAWSTPIWVTYARASAEAGE